MPILAIASLTGVSSMTLPVVVAGALAAVIVGLAVVAARRGASGAAARRIAMPVIVVAVILLAVTALLIQSDNDQRAADRRALLSQAAELDRSVLTPGSVLACVDGTAGETVGNACEKTVFATAQSAAAAVAYIGARIDLLEQAQTLGDAGLMEALAGTRRTIALDRYGIAAHVLAERDGCTAKRCVLFAALAHTDALKSNLKAQAYRQYVARYAAAWGEPAPASPVPTAADTPVVSSLPTTTLDAGATEPPSAPDAAPPAMAAVPAEHMVEVPALPRPRVAPKPDVQQAARETPAAASVDAPKSEAKVEPNPVPATAAPAALAPVSPQTAKAEAMPDTPAVAAAHRRPNDHWDYPSAESIPAISIMAPEPKLTKDAARRLRESLPKQALRAQADDAKATGKPKAADKPQKHPQPGEPLPLR